MIEPIKQTEKVIRDLMINSSKLEYNLNLEKDTQSQKLSHLYLDLLEIIDSFENRFKDYEENNQNLSEETKNWIKKFSITYKKLIKLINDEGIKPIIIKPGEEFDPNIHKGIETISDINIKNNSIHSEILKGYYLNGEVLRPSEVIINKNN